MLPWFGDACTSAIKFANHLGASTAFAAAWLLWRRMRQDAPVPILTAAYGTMLYSVNNAGIAPLLGITAEEGGGGCTQASERWVVHVIQTVVTALVVEQLTNTNVSPGIRHVG